MNNLRNVCLVMPSAASTSAAGVGGSSSRERVTVECLTFGYLSHSRLIGCDQQQQQQHPPDPLTAEVLTSLLALTDEYEVKFRVQLASVAGNCEVSADEPGRNFREVLDSVFHDGCNWGRVVTLFIFVGIFTRKCSDRPDVTVRNITDWTIDYATKGTLGEWISGHGGWMGLVQFHRSGDADASGQPAIPTESGVFRRLMTVAGAGLALATLGHLLTNRA